MALVLVVDDEKVTRKTIGKVLKSDGHHVIFASDGQRALTLLEDNPEVDLLVTDVVMPEMDGRELIRRLRSEPKTASLPTLIMSATVNVKEIRGLLEGGAGRFLAKPIAPGLLLDEVDSSLHHSQRSDALEAGRED